MADFKFKIIFLSIAFLFSVSLHAYECTNYFSTSDFANSHRLTRQQFRLLEDLAALEITTSHIANVVLKTTSLDEVRIKLGEMEQMGISIKAYEEIKKLVLKDVKQRKEFEEEISIQQKRKLRNSKIDGTRAIFHRIEPGSFLMGAEGKQVPTTISEPFELMATQTTQVIWKKIAELIHANLDGKYNINLDPSQSKGDTHPVEHVSYKEVQMWIEGLNALSQLNEPALVNLISGHKKGDVYRLPSEAEWEFVVRGRGSYNEDYHFGSKESELGEYAWFSGNLSAFGTHPVAQKKALIVDSKEFFDMHGNVSEWVMDRWDGQSPLPGGIDPVGKEGLYGILKGGSWMGGAYQLCSGCRTSFELEHRESYVGFRLLRVLN